MRYMRDEILNLFRGGKYSDDEILSPKQIEYEILQYRALFAKQDIDKGKAFMEDFTQFIPCVLLEVVDKIACCDGSQECYMLRSIKKIPKRIATNRGDSLSIYSTDTESIIPLQRGHITNLNSYARFTSSQKRSFIRDSYIYVTNDKLIRKVNLLGMFENPILAGKLGTCNNDTSCFNIDSPFPIRLDMVEAIGKAILINKLNITRYGETDKINDSSEEGLYNKR